MNEQQNTDFMLALSRLLKEKIPGVICSESPVLLTEVAHFALVATVANPKVPGTTGTFVALNDVMPEQLAYGLAASLPAEYINALITCLAHQAKLTHPATVMPRFSVN